MMRACGTILRLAAMLNVVCRVRMRMVSLTTIVPPDVIYNNKVHMLYGTIHFALSIYIPILNENIYENRHSTACSEVILHIR